MGAGVMRAVAAAATLVLVLLQPVGVAAADAGTKRLIISYNPSSGRSAGPSWESAIAGGDIAVVKKSTLSNYAVLEGSPKALQQAAALLPGNIEIEEDQIVSKHECANCKYKETSVVASSKERMPWGVKMVQADDPALGGSNLMASGVSVCVVDTGIFASHPDIKRNNFTGCDESCNEYGYAYDVPNDTHGTHVTGTIAALRGNGVGIVGVVPHGVNIYGFNALPFEYGGTVSLCLDGMEACARHLDASKKKDANSRMVVQMSFGFGETRSISYQRVLDKLYARGDMLFVASAGNEQQEKPGTYDYPAAYDSVISVAAVNCNGTVAPFSQQNTQVELAAPGVRVLSTTMPVQIPTVQLSINSRASGRVTLQPSPVESSSTGRIQADLVDCGMAFGRCLNATGKICLVERGKTEFGCKSRNAQKGKCAAILVYNNESPKCLPLDGVNIESVKCPPMDGKYLPFATLDKEEGQMLVALLKRGRVTGNLLISRGQRATFYQRMDGTSMAAPHVTGVAARLWGMFPKCRNVDIRQAMRESAKDRGLPGRDHAYGFGIVQAKAAAKVLAKMACAGGEWPGHKRSPSQSPAPA